jgi:RimJ/RimL family protein N-acetyltransferase
MADDKLVDVRARYPSTVLMRNGHSAQLRLMERGDADAVLAFARSLPEDDLLFLRWDITRPEIVDEWVTEIEAGRIITLLALTDDELLGTGDLYHNETNWTRHLGEIRLLLSPGARGSGLGRILADEIYEIAKLLGLRMLTAQMTMDQHGAQAIFRRLGFQREAVLFDYVVDKDGTTRDLLVATRRLAHER